MGHASRFLRRIANGLHRNGGWRQLSLEERFFPLSSPSLGSMVPKKEYFGHSEGWKSTECRVMFETVPSTRNQEHSYASSSQDARQAQEGAAIQSGMTMPSMQELRKLNPDMAEIVDIHETTQRSLSHGGILSIVKKELEPLSAPGKASVNVTKTSLMKLKVNVLRDILEQVGSDTRGNKPSLVNRILDDIRKDEENEQVELIASHLASGVANRKNIVKLNRLKEIQQGTTKKVPVTQTGATVPMNEPVQFSRVFSGPDEVAQILIDANASDVAIIDVRGACSFTDYMVIASGRSHQMVNILAHAIFYELKKRTQEVAPGVLPSVEGSDDPHPEWLVVDGGSIVVHVFHEDCRSEYDLEGLWGGKDLSNVMHVAMPQQRLTRDTIQ